MLHFNVAGMNNQSVLKQLENGYRMPKPQGQNITCPDSFYNLMKLCWHQNDESRPTFASLKDTFENFMVSTEDQYRDAEGI